MRPIKLLPLLMLLTAVLLSSCHKNDDTLRASLDSLEGEWILTNYLKKPLPADQQNRVTLQLTTRSDHSLTISGRCFVNSYGGLLKVEEANGLALLDEGVHSTDMAGTPEDMEAEKQYFKDLMNITSFEFPETGKLAIYLGDKRQPATEVLYFVRK